ncbi:MAG TPA: DUF423 domain-containing protein [Bacteroidia bacterium]|jgi:uncharacterized membrane protein YgdD (TMEM256/DUF423 family)|nr:DUF423 domain-containing protein [Bacteroidia bacterium]
MQKKLLIITGILGALAVTLGATGAHGLKEKLGTGLITEANLVSFETAARYHMYHSIVLLALVFLFEKFSVKMLTAAAYCFIIGILFFSGSLYLMATSKLLGLGNVSWLGPVTPLGGLFLIAGWILLIFAAIKK